MGHSDLPSSIDDQRRLPGTTPILSSAPLTCRPGPCERVRAVGSQSGPRPGRAGDPARGGPPTAHWAMKSLPQGPRPARRGIARFAAIEDVSARRVHRMFIHPCRDPRALALANLAARHAGPVPAFYNTRIGSSRTCATTSASSKPSATTSPWRRQPRLPDHPSSGSANAAPDALSFGSDFPVGCRGRSSLTYGLAVP